MKDIVTSFEKSKVLSIILDDTDTAFGWFGDESTVIECSPWVWISSINPSSSQEAEHRVDIGCKYPVCKAFTVAEMIPYFASSKRNEILQNTISAKYNSGHKLCNFIANPDFYADLIIEIYYSNRTA